MYYTRSYNSTFTTTFVDLSRVSVVLTMINKLEGFIKTMLARLGLTELKGMDDPAFPNDLMY